MKTQTIGTEIEFTAITRKNAAQVVANYFGTTTHYAGVTYKTWTINGDEFKTLRHHLLKNLQGTLYRRYAC